MPTLLLRFPGGRYHATPWGCHVNEGQIEWPPSPWRLLRAFIACGYSTLGWESVPSVGQRLIESLAGTLPTFRLPASSIAHSRHYMPTGVLEKGREKTSLVYDTWANTGDGVMAVRWDCTLDEEASNLFSTLACNLGYLGRSESWVEAQAISDDDPRGLICDTLPHVEGRRLEKGWEQVSLMAPEPSDQYAVWRQQIVAKINRDLPNTDDKKVAKKRLLQRENAIAPYPPELLDCLQRDTAWWKQHRWSQPPGSRLVLYWRRRDSLEVGAPNLHVQHRVAPVTTMLLSVTTHSGNKSALPIRSRTLPQAELFHRAIVGRVGKGRVVDCPELTGRDANGKPLHDHHRHAHILPLDLDADGHLDHILIYAQMGLGSAAQQAIRGLKRTWTKGSAGKLQVALAGSGDIEAIRSLPYPLNLQALKLLGPATKGCDWVSLTPFIPPRFLKRNGNNSLHGQINAELASRRLPLADAVEVLPWTEDRLRLRHFVRRRQHGGSPPPMDLCFALRIRLSEPILGPLTLGYASHFGMGCFMAAEIS